MNVGGGEAADQMVRMMLSSGEVTIRLTGSAMKNLLALTMALAKDHKRLSGKINMGKMLRETRDIRLFPMTPEQYKRFCKLAKRQKLLYSAIHDIDPKGDKLIDVVMPVTEIDRANLIFERMLYREPDSKPDRESSQKDQAEKTVSRPEEARQEQTAAKETQDHPQKAEKGRVDEQEGQHQAETPKKDFRSERDLPDTSGSSSTSSRKENETTSERPSVEARLKGYQEQLQKRRKSAPARQKTKARPKEK